MMQVLHYSLARALKDCGDRREGTYKPPSPKTHIKRYFCFLGICNVFNTGSGKIAVARSVAMLILALANHMAVWFKQLPSMLLSQKYSTGEHSNIAVKIVQHEYTMITAISTRDSRGQR